MAQCAPSQLCIALREWPLTYLRRVRVWHLLFYLMCLSLRLIHIEAELEWLSLDDTMFLKQGSSTLPNNGREQDTSLSGQVNATQGRAAQVIPKHVLVSNASQRSPLNTNMM